MTDHEREVELTHGRTRYIDAGSGPPVLLLHGVGFTSGGDSWWPMVGPLSTRLRVLAPDFMGLVCSLGQHEVAADAFTTFDKVVVDDWEQVRSLADFRQMAAAGQFDRSRLYAELPAVVAGEVPGRTAPDKRILVRTEGLVSQDVAVSWWLYQQACAHGLGLHLP